MSPPSRRTVLQTCSLALVGGFVGCSETRDVETNPTEPGTPTATVEAPESTPEPPNDFEVGGASLGLRSEYDEDVTVRVTVRMDGNRLVDESEALSPGMGTLVESNIPQPGEYVVEAGFGSEPLASYEWVIGEEYDGSLTAVVTADGDITFREQLDEPTCSTANLPYAAPDADETFTPGSATVRNESGQAVTVALSVAHDGETFFSCTQPLNTRQSVSIDQLTTTAGTYTVTVDVSGGGQTVYDWRIPADHSWPSLSVTIPGSGDPVVGCGSGGDIAVAVENTTDATRTTTLSLRRDSGEVAMDTVEVAANATAQTSLPTPVGDFYTLVATTDNGETQKEVVNCSCYGVWETTVTLDGSGPQIEAPLLVCN
ncbi:MAG: hypothetical protein V5A41_14375 [Haloarculaceae archaeon]